MFNQRIKHKIRNEDHKQVNPSSLPSFLPSSPPAFLNLPASASGVLGLQVFTTTTGLTDAFCLHPHGVCATPAVG
jgi:hypothetical protein